MKRLIFLVLTILLAASTILVGCSHASTPTPLTTTEPNAPPPLNNNLTLTINGSGTTNPAAGVHTFDAGTVVNLTATPASGWKFDNWTGDVATPTSASTTVTVDSAKTVVANFSVTYNLTLTVNGSGTTGPATGVHTFDAGTVVNLTVTPARGWKFDNWTGDVATPTSASTTVTVDSAKTVVANFSKITGYYLVLRVNGSGSTDPAAGTSTFDDRTVVNLTATPSSGWKFDNWTGDVAAPISASTAVTMNSTKVVVANFSKITYNLTLTINGSGATKPVVGIRILDAGTVVNLTATPARGWKFDNWTGDVAAPASASTTVTMDSVKSVAANFSKTYDLTLTITGNGTTNPAAGIHTFFVGTVVDLMATPASGWKFDGWTGDVAAPTSASTTVTMNSDKTVVANFGWICGGVVWPTTYNLTLTINGSGTTEPAAGIHTFFVGTVVDLMATPASGWKFDGWTGDVAAPTSASTTVTMNSVKSVAANFSNDNWHVFTTGWTNMGEVYKDGAYATVPGTVMKIGSKYVIYYHRNYHRGINDGKGEIFIATSNNPTSAWTAYSDNPVLTWGSPGKWDEKWVTMANVVFDNGTYYMFYEGSNFQYSNIGYATSADGYTWIKQTVDYPILEHGSTGWDGTHVGTPFVIKVGSIYHMFFHGNGDGIYTDRIGYATASLITGPYTKCLDNPTFLSSPSGWDSKWVGQRAIFYFQGIWVMMYEGNESLGVNDQTGTQTGIATATSLDSSWSRSENNPVFSLAGGNDNTRNNPVVFSEGSKYYVYMSSLPYDGVVLSFLDTIPQSPKITGVFPNSGGPGWTLAVITGTDFTGATAVSFGEGITVNSFDVNSAIQVTANITISTSATAGVRNISVTNAFGTDILVNGFTVNNNSTYTTLPASTFDQTNSLTKQITPISSLNNWKVTFENTVQWASPLDNPRVGLGFFSGLAYSTDPSIQLIEYYNGSLDVVIHIADYPDGHKLVTIQWSNPVTISLISGNLTVSSPAGFYVGSFPSFSLAYVTGGSTQLDTCSGGEVDAQVEGDQ